jgi:hypothetical protein
LRAKEPETDAHDDTDGERRFNVVRGTERALGIR